MRLLTLMEYCLLIFFMGIYLSATGFNARDFGILYWACAYLHTGTHLFETLFTKARERKSKGRIVSVRFSHYWVCLRFCVGDCDHCYGAHAKLKRPFF